MACRSRGLGREVVNRVLVAAGIVGIAASAGCAASPPPEPTPPPGQYAPMAGPPAGEQPPPAEPPPSAEPEPPPEPPFACPEAPAEVPAAPKQGPRIAVVLLVDRSPGMKDVPIEKAKEAAEGVLGQLKSDDWFGVIGFEKTARTYVKAQPAHARSRIQVGIRRMGPDRRGARLGPGFELAGEHLAEVAAKKEHVVVITNSNLDQAGADAALVLAKTGATISTLAFGEAPDKERTGCVPKVGRGEMVWLDSPEALPEQLKKEIERVLSK